MGKFHVAQNNFNGGVLGRLLHDRYDMDTFNNSLKQGLNGFPLTEGPVTKRAGSIYVDDVKNNAKARLIPFRFSKDVKYVLEFTPNNIRFFKDRAYIHSMSTNITQAMYEDIYTAQLSDLLLMVSAYMPPKQLKRTNDTTWALSNIDFYDGPYSDTNTTDTELYCSAATGSVTLNATTDLFTSDDVGRHWRLRSGNGWAWGVTTAFINARQLTITVREGSMPISPYQTKLWKRGLFSNSDGNYPTVIALHAKRLWLGGFKNNPSTVVASKTSDFFNFAPADIDTTSIAENNSVSINLSASGVSDIQFIAGSDKGLDIGTSGGIWIVDTSEGIVNQSSYAALKNSQGAANIEPIVTGPSVIYVQRSTKKLMDIQYSFTEDGYNAPELSLYNRDYMKNGLKSIVYQQDPISCVWCLDKQGQVYSLNYDKNQSVYAWFAHDFSGFVESLTVVPSPAGDSEDVWLSVRRMINNKSVRYLEYMPSWEEMYYQTRNKKVYCDCAFIQTYENAVDTLSGLGKLEGCTVAVLIDGNYAGQFTVTGGKIELPEGVTVKEAVVGLVTTFGLATIDKNYGFTNGSTMHRVKRISQLKVGLMDSLGGEYNVDGGDKYYPLIFFNSSVNLDKNVPFFTGVKDIDVRPLHDEFGTIYIRHRQNLPFFVTSITYDTELD